MENDELEVVQNVIDRVSAYQDGAPDGTVEEELRRGLDDAGVALGDDDVRALAAAVEASPGEVKAADVLS